MLIKYKNPDAVACLLLRIQNNDTIAFNQLTATQTPYIRRILAARQPCQRCSYSSDQLQETLARIWKIRKSYQPTGSGSSFIYGIAKYVLLEHCKKCSKHRTVQLTLISESPATPNEPIEILIDAEAAHNVLKKLPTKDRQALELVYLQSMSLAEAADLLKCSTGALKSRLSRARKRLRNCLAPCALSQNVEPVVSKNSADVK